MKDYSLVRLFNTDGDKIVHHIESLDDRDRYLRFGFTANNAAISKYVHHSLETVNTRDHADFWFAIQLAHYIVATIHVAIRGEMAEFAFTTSTEHRGKGLGQLLFARGYQLVTEYSVKQIYMVCLSSNGAIKHIAKKYGMIIANNGTESEASITVPPNTITFANNSFMFNELFQISPPATPK